MSSSSHTELDIQGHVGPQPSETKAGSTDNDISFTHVDVLDQPGWDGQLDRLDEHIHDDHGDPHRAALEDIDPNAKVSRSTWAAVFFLAFTFQPSLSFTILCAFPILGPIALELQGNTTNVNWMASGFTLTGSVSFAIAGQLSDYFGRRWLLLFAQALLIAGHIVGATANTVNQGIAAMAILGFGCGTCFVLYPGISELLPNKQRPLGLAFTELNILPFTTFGPLIGRTLLQNLTWRWVFYLGIITGAISLIGTAAFYFPPAKPLRDRTRLEILAQLDYLGIFLYGSGLTLFLLGLGWGGISFSWASAGVLAPLLLGAVLFGCAFLWDFSGRPKRPIFPYRLLSNIREYTLVLVVIFVTGFVYFTLTDLIPAQIGYMYTSDEIKAGLYNIPGGFGGAAGGVFLGGMIHKIKYVHLQLAVGIAVQTIFTALLALSTPDNLPMALVFQLFANIPFAWITLCCYVTASLHVSHRDLGLGLGLIGTFRFLGGSVGTTVFSTIVNNKAAVTIPARVVPALAPLGYPSSRIPDLIAAIAAGTTADLANTSAQVIEVAAEAVRWGWSDAFRVTWLVSLPFGVIAFVLALFVRDPSMYFTAHTSVTLEKGTLDSGKKDIKS
jgi:MFS family permease